MPTPKQLDEEAHYFDRLAQIQMSDSLAYKKDFNIDGVSIVKGTENNEEWLNILCGSNN